MATRRLPASAPFDGSKLGCSQAAATLGVDRFKTALDVLWGLQHPEEQGQRSEPAEWGLLHQHNVFLRGLKKLDEAPKDWTENVSLVDDSRPWLRISLDAERFDESMIMECKTHDRSLEDQYGAEWSDQILESELLQAQGYLHLTGASVCHVPVLFGGNRHRMFRVEPNAELGAFVLETLERFWTDHVVGGQPLPIDGSESAKRFLAKRFPDATSAGRPASSEEMLIALDLANMRRTIREAETSALVLENRLKERIGDAASVTWDRGSATWGRPQTRADDAAIEEFLAREAFGANWRQGLAEAKQKFRGAPFRPLRLRVKGEAEE